MNYLHPGTVTGPDIDKDYVIIQLDDGDCRDIHIQQVRYLPEHYPLQGKNIFIHFHQYMNFILQIQNKMK